MKTNLLLALLAFGSLFGYAQKAPKGKLISYSHKMVNPEMPLNRGFELDWKDGKGTLVTHELFINNTARSTANVSEDVFRRVADMIKEKKLYTIGKKKAKKKGAIAISDPSSEDYAICFEDMSVVCDGKDVTLEQRQALDALEAFIKQSADQEAPAPQGNLVECSFSWRSLNPGSGGEYKCLTLSSGEAVLTVGQTNTLPDDTPQEQKYVVTPEDVKRLQQLIIDEKAYLFDGYNGKDHSGRNPETQLLLKYDSGETISARWTHMAPPDHVVRAQKLIRNFLDSLIKLK